MKEGTRKTGERTSVEERRERLYQERVRIWSEYREKEMRISEQERMLDALEREEETPERLTFVRRPDL